MRKAISNKNVLAAKFDVAEFDGPWLASFGKPELRGVWIVYGGSGCGKTSFVMQLSKYLSRFREVAYNSLEQGLSLSLKTAWERTGMIEAGNRIVLLDKEQLGDLKARLRRKRSPGVVIIDSVHYLNNFRFPDCIRLVNEFNNKLFVFVVHEKDGQPKDRIGNELLFNADVKIRVVGYKAFFASRYSKEDTNEGGADFVIWEQGARQYWLDKY